MRPKEMAGCRVDRARALGVRGRVGGRLRRVRGAAILLQDDPGSGFLALADGGRGATY